MKRCAATTTQAAQCLRWAIGDSDYCEVHADRGALRTALAVGGAIVGNLLAPGLGGAAVGALTGWALGSSGQRQPSAKKRVFISFDFDNDRAIKDFLIGQSRLNDSPFEVTDCSLQEAAPMKSWQDKARTAIRSADLVIVLLGPETHRANGVLREIRMAQEESIQIIQIIGYPDRGYTPIPGAGGVYRWTWDNLKKLLSY